jgi:hypothetical protein
MLGSVSAGLGEGGGLPALKAAAADPRGSLTASATEAGEWANGQKWRKPPEMPALLREVQKCMKEKRPVKPDSDNRGHHWQGM